MSNLPISIQDNFDFKTIKVIAGLGNVGKEYENTRHNAGFLLVEKLAGLNQFKEEKKLNCMVSKLQVNSSLIYLIKPTTFMNSSGRAVSSFLKYFNIKPDSLLVCHDDLDISTGKCKFQIGKGPRVHNGIISIEESLATQNFWRCRIGIENRNKLDFKIPGKDYVLGRLSEEEKNQLDLVFNAIKDEFKF